jgi:hypothetical protein
MTTEVYPFAPKGLPWLRYDIALPAVFMVFLIFPVSSIWNDSVLSAGAKALGYVIVLVFGVSWLVAFAWLDIVPSRRSSVWVRWCAVFFLLLTAGLWQLIQWNAIGLLPFVISFLVYLSPPREAGLLSLVLLGATVGLAVVQGWPSGSIELLIVSTLVLIFASVSVGLGDGT